RGGLIGYVDPRSMSAIMLRSGRPEDAAVLLDMFDGAVAWLVERGRAGQWGSTPFSKNPKRVARVRAMAADPGLVIAEIDGVAAGAAIFADHPPAHTFRRWTSLRSTSTCSSRLGSSPGEGWGRSCSPRRGRRPEGEAGVWCGWTVGQV